MTPIRRLALIAITVAAFGAGPLVSQAEAKHKHGKWCRHDNGNHYGQRSRYDSRYDPRYDRSYDRRYGTYDAEKCENAHRRIAKASYEIRKNEGTGRHQDALRWFKNDIRDAYGDRARYCAGRGPSTGAWRWDTRDDYDYDRYDRDRGWYDNGSYDRYDPYYGDGDGFDIKRDWPSMLGLFLGGGLGAGAGY